MLVPPSMVAPTPGAPLPAGSTQGDWAAFADAQTGQLDTANTHKTAIVEILTACEKRDAQIAKELQPKRFLGIF